MEIMAGFAMVWAIGWSLTKGAEAAVNAIRKHYQARTARFRAVHPTSNRAAAAGASLAATLRHGTKPALQAFRDDWRKHYNQRRDEVKAKYMDRTTWSGFDPPPPPPAAAKGPFDDDPKYQELRRIREDEGYTGWLDQDLNKVSEPFQAFKQPLRIIPGGLNTTSGGTVPNLPVGEVRNFATMRNNLSAFGQHLKLESDDAAATLQRVQDNHAWLVSFYDQCRATADNDPELVGYIASILEPARVRVEAAKTNAQAADAELAATQQSMAGVNKHSAMEEAVGATPQASSNTAVYQGN